MQRRRRGCKRRRPANASLQRMLCRRRGPHQRARAANRWSRLHPRAAPRQDRTQAHPRLARTAPGAHLEIRRSARFAAVAHGSRSRSQRPRPSRPTTRRARAAIGARHRRGLKGALWARQVSGSRRPAAEQCCEYEVIRKDGAPHSPSSFSIVDLTRAAVLLGSSSFARGVASAFLDFLKCAKRNIYPILE